MVQTHDVGVEGLRAPTTARSGQTRRVVADISNERYPDTVRIDLYRSTPTGFELVASQTLGMPLLHVYQTRNVVFDYTLTSADAAIGKVSFKAVAGDFTMRMPSLRETSSKDLVEVSAVLAVAVADQEAHAPIGEVEAEVARLLGRSRTLPGSLGRPHWLATCRHFRRTSA